MKIGSPFIFYDTPVNTFIPLEKLNLHILCLWPFVPKYITLQNARSYLEDIMFLHTLRKSLLLCLFLYLANLIFACAPSSSKKLHALIVRIRLALLIKCEIEF
jgi:hypothetical protein